MEAPRGSSFAKPPTDEHRGVPEAVFLEDIPEAVAKHGAQDALADLTVLLQKYKFWESRLANQRRALAAKIPSTEQNLSVITMLEERQSQGKPVETTFEISDQLFVRGKVEDCGKVGVWLGANVMVQLSTEEARALLQKSLDEAQESMKAHTADLQFLRDQMNVTEVNMTRIFNHDVMQNRGKKA